MQLPAREAALEKIWANTVVDSTNSLINYERYYEKDDGGQAVACAQWQSQENTT